MSLLVDNRCPDHDDCANCRRRRLEDRRRRCRCENNASAPAGRSAWVNAVRNACADAAGSLGKPPTPQLVGWLAQSSATSPRRTQFTANGKGAQRMIFGSRRPGLVERQNCETGKCSAGLEKRHRTGKKRPTPSAIVVFPALLLGPSFFDLVYCTDLAVNEATECRRM